MVTMLDVRSRRVLGLPGLGGGVAARCQASWFPSTRLVGETSA